MTVVPNKDLDAVQFFESHVPVWAATPAAVGLTAAQVAALDTATKAARNAYTAQQNARNAAKASTSAYHTNVGAMREIGGDLIKTIKAFAATSNNPNVYAIAQIPMPAEPAPLPPPGQPNDFDVRLTGSGAIVLSWKCANAAPSSGAYFTVRRRIGTQGAFTLVGGTGSRTFIDDSIPAGSPFVTYLVQGFRGEQPGPESELVSVQFGAGDNFNAQFKLAA